MEKGYQNPVPFVDGKRRTNPDPFVMRWCGKYYCYATDEKGVQVSVSEDLVNWESRGYALSDPAYRDYWAPSVFYRNGKFYMYYSNIPSDQTDCHQEHLKLAVSDDPEKGFEWKKTFFEEFSIDSHPMFWNGKLYMFYSVNNWLGKEEKVSGTCILVDEMKTPEEFAGNPKEVILPSIPQEIYAADRFADGRDWYTIEGAAHVIRGNRCWLMYSANAYENVDYFVGTTVAQCRENLEDMEWKKYPNDWTWEPLLCKNEQMEGTGHNTVAKAPNMVDEWIVYHGRRAEEELIQGTEQREMCIDPLYFSGDHLICHGPSAGGEEAPAAAEIQIRDMDVQEMTVLAPGSDFYLAEFWLSAQRCHAGARYGILLEYEDEDHWFELHFHSGRKELQMVECRCGVQTCLGSIPLDRDFDYTVPHLFRITKRFETYTVEVDDEKPAEILRQAPFTSVAAVRPHFTDVKVHSFALTRTIRLYGNYLSGTGRLLKTTDCKTDGTEIRGRKSDFMTFGETSRWEQKTEVLQVRPCRQENSITVCRGSEKYVLAEEIRNEISVIHVVRDGKDCFIVDGLPAEIPADGEGEACVYELKGLALREYEITKN